MADSKEKTYTDADLPQKYVPFLAAVNKLYTDPKYSDMVAKCGERAWPVHKAIVCSRSNVIAMEFDNPSKEAEEGIVRFDDHDPRVVEAMLYYLYNFEYSDVVNEQEAFSPIVFNVYVHSIADKYNIDDLEKLAVSKFSSRAKEEWNSQAFADAIQLVFGEAADRHGQLRETILNVCSKHAKELHSSEYGAAFRAVALSVPEFGGELSGRLAKSRVEAVVGKTYRCSNCSTRFAMEMKAICNYYCPNCGSSWHTSSWSHHEVKDE